MNRQEGADGPGGTEGSGEGRRTQAKRAVDATRRMAWVVGWAVLTALVALGAGTVDWGVVVRSLGGADPLPLLAAVSLNATILLLATVQWSVFLPRGHAVRGRTMFGIIAVTSSVSNGGPLLAGHATGLHLLATRGGVGHATSLSVTLLDQLCEGVAKVSIVVLAALATPLAFQYRTAALTLAVGVPALWVAAAVAASRSDALDRLEARVHGAPALAIRFLAETARHLGAVREPGRVAAGIGLALAQKLAEALAILMVAWAFGVSLPAWGVVGVLVAVNLSTLVSVTPANLGMYEASAVLVYSALGLTGETAVTLAIVQHGAYLLPLAGTGWLLESLRLLRGESPPSPPRTTG